MKKLLFSIAFVCAIFSNAQTIETKSSCDSNADGKVDVTDVSNTVNKVLGKVAAEKQVVTAEDLNAVLKSINEKLESNTAELLILKSCLTSIASKVNAKTPEDIAAEQAYNGHAYVDLGLSVKWATMNVGATEVAGSKTNSHTGQLDCYGEYYAWGETSPKDVYSSQSFFDSTYFKYHLPAGKTTLDLEDDAARANWGGSWRMPTTTEQQELLDNCYWEWTTSYDDSGVKGYIVYKVKDDSDKGKHPYYDNNYIVPTPTASYSLADIHIFLPASGYREETNFGNVGSDGNYWSSSLGMESANKSYYLSCVNNKVEWFNYCERHYGFVVRPVCK